MSYDMKTLKTFTYGIAISIELFRNCFPTIVMKRLNDNS